MRVTTSSKRKKGAASADTHQQPLQIDQSPQPKRTQGKSTMEAADLQEKMMEAARLTMEFEYPEGKQPLRSLEEEDRDVIKLFFCTPEAVFYKLGSEYIRVTEENLVNVGVTPGNARIILKALRYSCRRMGKVSWVFPKDKEVAK